MKEFLFNYKLALKKYFDIKGRSRRKEFWYFILGNLLISFFLSIIDILILKMNILHNILLILTIIPTLTVSIRRLHDINKSGYWILLNFVPLLILIFGNFIGDFISKENLQFFILSIIVLTIISSFIISVVLFYWFSKIGTENDNRYGEDPFLRNKTIYKPLYKLEQKNEK